MKEERTGKGFFNNPILRTKIKSAHPKLFPEGLLGYFVGPTFALLTNSILSGYLNKYMTDILDMNVWASGFLTWLPVISVLFVIAGNIIVGRIMDHLKTSAGKARPLLLMSIPLAVLALLLLYIISPFATNVLNTDMQIMTLICIAIGYNLWFAIAYPFYYTSHAALVNLSTRNGKSRSLLATLSNATALAAMGLTNMVLPFFYNLLFVPIEGTTMIDQQASYDHWKIFVIALIVVNVIGVIAEYFFTRERVTEETADLQTLDRKQSVSIKQQAKICFKDKFWVIIIIFFFLYQLGGMMKNVSQLYFCQALFEVDLGGGVMGYSNTNASLSGLLAMIGAIPTALGMVVALPLANKIGKGKAIMFGAILSAIGGLIGFIAPSNFAVVTTSFVIKAFGSTPAMYLSMALMADILDHQEAMHGVRTDGLTMTIYGAIMAGMTGVATGLMNAVLGAVGYTATNFHSPAVQEAMKWIFIGGETICYIIIFVIFIFMGVEKFTKFDQKAIRKDQKTAAEAEGKEFIDPMERMKLEEAEAEAEIEAARIVELKAKCEKKGLDFEAEEAAYQAKAAAAREAAEQKKKAAEEKRAAAEREKQARFDALSDEEKKAETAKLEAAAKKRAEREAAILAEFNKQRSRNGKPELSDE